MPEEREVLIMSVIAGRSVSIYSDRSLAVAGLDAHLFDGCFTRSEVTGVKQVRGD